MRVRLSPSLSIVSLADASDSHRSGSALCIKTQLHTNSHRRPREARPLNLSPYTERKKQIRALSRFEAGELVALRAAFERHANGNGNRKVRKDEVLEVLGDVPGYEGVLGKDYVYVLEEAGFGDRVDVDFDEFVEISGNLKEVSVVPSAPVTKQKRMRIPVEKSGARGV
ncbi:hypothetical protein BDQ17DRAFT_1546385 [Cyathus striatus]|nr:hypothetical protein BDQ17DRAFT_1546385 [Cyathus striatus]